MSRENCNGQGLRNRLKSRGQSVGNLSKSHKIIKIYGCNRVFFRNWGVTLTSCTPPMEALVHPCRPKSWNCGPTNSEMSVYQHQLADPVIICFTSKLIKNVLFGTWATFIHWPLTLTICSFEASLATRMYRVSLKSLDLFLFAVF